MLGIYTPLTKDPSGGGRHKGWEEKGVVGSPGATVSQSPVLNLNLAF